MNARVDDLSDTIALTRKNINSLQEAAATMRTHIDRIDKTVLKTDDGLKIRASQTSGTPGTISIGDSHQNTSALYLAGDGQHVQIGANTHFSKPGDGSTYIRPGVDNGNVVLGSLDKSRDKSSGCGYREWGGLETLPAA